MSDGMLGLIILSVVVTGLVIFILKNKGKKFNPPDRTDVGGVSKEIASK